MCATANSLAVRLLAKPLRMEVVQGFKLQGVRCKGALLGKPAVAPVDLAAIVQVAVSLAVIR